MAKKKAAKKKANKKKPFAFRFVDQPVAKTPLPEKGYARVYKVACALDEYLVLEGLPRSPEAKMRYPIEIKTPNGPRIIEREPFSFWGREMPGNWKPVPMRLLSKHKQPEPDFWKIWSTTTFAMTPKAFGLFEKDISPLGQVLTVPYNNQSLKVLNLLHCIDCLDLANCAWDDFDEGTHTFLATLDERKIAFKPKKLDDAMLFTFPQEKENYFCIERTGDPKKEFKARYESAGLTGLSFDLVWEGKA